MRHIQELPSLNNVAAGNQATLNLPVGMTYHRVMFAVDGPTLAEIQNIEVLINGKVIQVFKDAAELDAINQYYDRGAFTGTYLNLWFDKPELGLRGVDEQQEITAIGTGDVQTFTIRFDIDSAATVNSIKALAEKSDKINSEGPDNPLGVISKIKAFPSSFATSGEQEIDNLPKGGARIAAIHLFKGDVDRVEVDVDSRTVWEADKAAGHEILTRYQRTPQTSSATHLEWTYLGDQSQALATEGVQDLRIKPTIGSSGAIRSVVEYLDSFDGI